MFPAPPISYLPSPIFHLLSSISYLRRGWAALDRRGPKMTEEGMFLLGIVMGILLHAATKILIGLIKVALIALGF
jgi:hypothetical protein